MDQSAEVLAIVVLGQGSGQLQKRFIPNPAIAPGDLLRTGDLETLPSLQGFNELPRLTSPEQTAHHARDRSDSHQ